MHKRIISEWPLAPERDWLSVDLIAEVQVTSESPDYPVENALCTAAKGWRAAEPGPQTVRLQLVRPIRIRSVRLCFNIHEERTQEFVLRWRDDHSQTHEHVRQQFNFSFSTPMEVENYMLDMDNVCELELAITPDITGARAFASVEEWLLR